MATKVSTCFLNHSFISLKNNTTKYPNVQFPFASRRSLPTASSKMRQRSSYRRQQVKRGVPELPPTIVGDDEQLSESENASSSSSAADISVPIMSEEMGCNDDDDDDSNEIQVEHVNEPNFTNLNVPHIATSLVVNRDGGEHLSTVQLEDLIGMIRNAEKNILLLNEARVRALEDLEKILNEKDALQGEINSLEMKLAETDARIKVAAQEKVQVELLENQLERLQNELSQRSGSEGRQIDMYHTENKLFNEHNSSVLSLDKELDSLRTENLSLKNDIQELKAELNNVKNKDERVVLLEKERSSLESSLKEWEAKLSISQEEVSKLSSLKADCKDLWEKVENLQELLSNATKQADQAILVSQQNQELRKKIDKLEKSLEEANVYKISSDKMQLMQQKIKLLEERLQRSDEEIQSYVELYHLSVKEFQDTLNSLKEESKKRALDEPVDDLPWEFWSRILLIIDGWLLEEKISASDAKMLRERVWKRDRRICDAYMACKEKNERDAVSMFLRLTSTPTSPGLHVIHIAAEMAPVAKVGGLGDVVAGLGKALQKRGHLVEIVLPKYDCMQYDRIRDLRALDVVIESYFDGKLYKNKIWVGTVEGLPVYFIEPHHPNKFFWRGQFYGEHDDFRRFSYFSRAALELLLQAGKKPDIIHCHDWQTAFVAPLYWDIYAPKGLNSARICFTCHNFEYQGTAPASELGSCGLDVHQLNRPDRMQDNTAHDRINPLKGAIVFSNIVTTVSPTYAQEVRSAEGGRGLHTTLNFHSKKFVGLLNGIDTDAWNPATDTFLKVQYSASDIQGKAENKAALRMDLGLSSTNVRQPLIGCITRLVPQKGVHLIRHAIYRTLELGGQFILLGSSPVPHIQREFEGIANQFQNHDHIRLVLKYCPHISPKHIF
ncbi:Glyco_transf_5 domain-containing protein [Cephalotus follicularis]|uniref:starch synthase n=1 Tax=Cephalotus follicularis TaxID=3775 RepID=A0A1Q3CTD9_CEPFO|nr:Glyco_transf_5 domain-containing protein [Cephalotus follicularis]